MIRALLVVIVILSSCIVATAAEFTYDDHGTRDPLLPLVDERGRKVGGLRGVSSLGDLVLEGIAWDKHSTAVAIMNGEIVRVGDDLDGLLVEEIHRNRVVVKQGEQRHTIWLAGEDVDAVQNR